MPNVDLKFIPKKWLGDAAILAMDWDCRGMHIHLMCIASQQEKFGHILFDENLICKLLGNLPIDEWNNRIKKQLLFCWKTKKIKNEVYFYLPGLLKYDDNVINTKVKKLNVIENENELDVSFEGFNLLDILKVNPSKSILFIKPEQATKEENSSIWTLGVQLFLPYENNEKKVRGFLAKQIKEFGSKNVAQAIAQISIGNFKPADMNAYFLGILKKMRDTENNSIKKTGRGSVAI